MGPNEAAARAAILAAEAGPRVAVVSSAEVAEQDTLNADYWCNRHGGETYPQFRVRRQVEDIEQRARKHEAAAVVLRDQAARLREGTVA